MKNLSNKDKFLIIDDLRPKYKLKDLLDGLDMAKSSYCYHKKRLLSPGKYKEERLLILTIFHENNARYGYRRIHQELKNAGYTISEKVVRRIMVEENLVAKQVRKKKYSSYAGEVTPAVPNVIKRDFKANKPNEKWLTDITEFKIPSGKIYLSPMVDCFDGCIVSWTISTAPTAELVNEMLDQAAILLKEKDSPIIHSDRGGHYRWPGWIDRMEKLNLTRSMSKKGCSPDNSACEGFFGRLKVEFFYGEIWKNSSIDEFIDKLDQYIIWYNEKRIKMSLGGMSPMAYRQSLGLVA